jgi:hypothetical protein
MRLQRMREKKEKGKGKSRKNGSGEGAVVEEGARICYTGEKHFCAALLNKKLSVEGIYVLICIRRGNSTLIMYLATCNDSILHLYHFKR